MFKMNRHVVAKTAAVLAMAVTPLAVSGVASADVTAGNGERVCEVSVNGVTQSGTGDECDDLLASVPSYGSFDGTATSSSSSSSSSASASSDGERVCEVSVNGVNQSGTGDECDDLVGPAPSYEAPDFGSFFSSFGGFSFGPWG